MTFSSLITGTIPNHGKYNARPSGITRVIQHHWAGTSGGIERLSNPNQKASATYLQLTDGQLLGQVPEEFRPWTSGGAAADNPSITIECQNSTNGPDWCVSDEAINGIIHLLADIASRHNFGQLTVANYRGHREFASTACPGPYLWPKLQEIRDATNSLFSVGSFVVPSGTIVDQTPPAMPGPRLASDGNLWLDEDGSLGPATISRWQQIMGTPIDGVISRPSMLITAVQNTIISRGHSCGRWGADGSFGPATIGALQDELGTPRDGVISVPRSSMVVALQERLNASVF